MHPVALAAGKIADAFSLVGAFKVKAPDISP